MEGRMDGRMDGWMEWNGMERLGSELRDWNPMLLDDAPGASVGLEPTAAAIQLSRCDASVRHLYILMDMPIPFRVGEVALLGRQFLGTPAIWAEGFIHVPSLSE